MNAFVIDALNKLWEKKKDAIFTHYIKLSNDEIDLEQEEKEYKERIKQDREERINQVNRDLPPIEECDEQVTVVDSNDREEQKKEIEESKEIQLEF